jgi:hypothetical protein
MAKAHADSWAVTDEFWARAEPLVTISFIGPTTTCRSRSAT